MKKSIILILLISFCGGNLVTIEDESTTTITESQDTTTTTTASPSTTTTVAPSTTTTESQESNEVNAIEYSNLPFQVNVNKRNANCKIREYIQSIDIPVKQHFEEIGWDKPKSFEDAEICFLYSDGISDEFIKQHSEFHNIVFDYLGAYDRYVHYVYSKNDGENTDALEILNQLGVYGSTTNTVEDFFDDRSCLSGFFLFNNLDSGINEYSFCNQPDPFLYTPWIANDKDKTLSYYDLMFGWAHEYFHHYQRKFTYDRTMGMDTDSWDGYKHINVGAWHTEGAANVFPKLLLREVYDDLSLTIDNNYPQPERRGHDQSLPDEICSNVQCDWEGEYYEVKQHIMGQGTYDKGDVKCREMSSLQDSRDTWSCGVAGNFIVNMYLAYITSFETMFFEILEDSYESSFPESFEKNVGMSLEEFYTDFNNFMREGNVDDPPPPGFFPTEPLSKLVNFKNK